MSSWYAVRSATRMETKALAGLAEQGFAVFLPCETVERLLGGAKEYVSRPLFPGYLFILCDPDAFRQILEVEGVHQFVRFGTGENLQPFPFPTSEIIELQAQERAGEFDRTRTKKAPYRPRKGDKVQVTAGPWQTYIGRVLNTPTKDRVLVKIEGPFGKGKTLDVAHLKAA
jgi:transcription antitermination factor NusG